MKGGNIVNIIANTLHSNTIQHSAQQLNNIRQNKGFTIQLLLISDDPQYDITIRQAALIYLKNTIQDHCTHNPLIDNDDLNSLKASLLLALIRSIGNNKLAPTYRQIIYQLAEKYYPREWPEIVTQALNFIEKATDFSQLHGSVQALKTIFSVFGKSISKEIQLSNLSNKTIIPILNLASKLFQSFNEDTSIVLISIFKLICTAISFYIPPIFQKNIHSLMIFIKKILDIKVLIQGPQNYSFYLLKKLSLRILFRIYQRHANIKFTNNQAFANLFHSKYTKSFVETLILQMIEPNQTDKTSKSKHMELVKFSLSCLAYINNQHAQSANILQLHRNSLLNLCLSKFKINLNKNYRSFLDFRLYVQQNRIHMKEFLFSLLRCDAIPEHQEQNMSSILTLLLECIKNGDNQLKQLALYLFSEMSSEIKTLRINIQQKIGIMIGTQIKNLLNPDNHVLVRARACNLIASYNDIDLPEEHLSDISMLVYNCLLVGDTQKETFLKVYACNAFNSLLKYNQIYEHIKPHLQQILKIYTKLLQVDVSIIKNVEDLLDLLEDQIAPFANDLVSLLIGHFTFYSSKINNQSETHSDLYNNQQLEEDDQNNQDEEQFQESNNESIARAMISSIRQILQSQNTVINPSNSQQLFSIVIKILSDPSQLYLQQGFNILNLLLYKLKQNVNPKYYIFLKVIFYAILGVPSQYINNLSHGNNFDKSFALILNNICTDPDQDIISNSIGALRNFIAKSDFNVLRQEKDHFGTFLIEYFFKLVKIVHENLDKKYTQTDRLIILTIYTSLVEYKMITEEELSALMNEVLQWMQMEIQVVQSSNKQNGSFGSTSKYTYTPVYLQIIMLCIFSYGKIAASKFNIDIILNKMIQLKQSFRCDYQISRVIVGIASILKLQEISDSNTIANLMNSIPGFVFNLCKLRQEGDRPQNDIQMDDQAEQQQFFGDDDNTMMIGWRSPKNPTPKDLLLSKQSKEKEEQDQDDDDWQMQFNKYYESTLDNIDEIKMLQLVLKEQGNRYCQFMDIAKQQELSLYLSNAPPKVFS